MQLATHAEPIWHDFARRMSERAKRMTAPVEYRNTWSAGQLAIAIPLAVLAITLSVQAITYSIGHGQTADDTKQQVADLRGDVNKRFDNQSIEINKRFDILALQIVGIPTQAANIAQLIEEEKQTSSRLSEDEARITATDRAAYTASETASELAKMVDQLRQQMNAPVPLRTTR